MDQTIDPIAQAVENSQYASLPENEREDREKEQNCVKVAFEEYEQARKFDKHFIAQCAVDRRYAAGTADSTWAVNTNLIGSFIDILTSFLYARNPDVSVKKAEQVDNRGTRTKDDFAKTMELVVSNLWKKGKLKSAIRKQVRAALSVGEGYFKAVLIADKPNNPEMQNEMNDLRDNIARLEAVQLSLSKIEGASTEQAHHEILQQQELITGLENRIEVTIRKYLAIDFIATQDFQCALDVANTEDYLDADWNANAIYILKNQVGVKFPRLTEDEVKSATSYYQRQSKDLNPITDSVGLMGVMNDGSRADEAEYYTKGTSATGTSTGSQDQSPEFVKVIELWDKRVTHIHTMIDGVKRWARDPYQPPYASTRFYPYFRLAFFEVDGARHSQSLSWRLHKLQDEYARSRSNFRISRERAIPGTLFNAAGVDPSDVRKIEGSVHQEFIGITPTDPTVPLSNLFAEKPVSNIDPRLYDNSPILGDMEKISGVQEALQSSTTTPITATQANIQQSGFASRTTSDRDSLEDVMNELANYTGEVALSGLTTADAQRIGGPSAFWPAKMDINDLLTMVEISIKAGTTGKPNKEGDKQAWGVVLPVISESIVKIYEAIAIGNMPLASSLSEVVRETMRRMGDDTDPETFLPAIPSAASVGDPLALPIAPPGGVSPTLPPMEGGAAGGALPPPVLDAPNLQNPTL